MRRLDTIDQDRPVRFRPSRSARKESVMGLRSTVKEQVRTILYTVADWFVDLIFGVDDPENMKPERTQ